MPQGASGQGAVTECPGGAIEAEVTARGVVFRPSRARTARTMWAVLVFTVAFPILLAVVLLIFEPTWITSVGAVWLVVFGAIVFVSLALGIAAYRSSVAIPLLAEPTGRVLYGQQVLLEVGAAARLFIEEQWNEGESGSGKTYSVVSSNRWGPVVRFPAPWFDEFDDRGVAVWFAQQLGASIGAEVEVIEPGAAPDPTA